MALLQLTEIAKEVARSETRVLAAVLITQARMFAVKLFLGSAQLSEMRVEQPAAPNDV
jgi:hypothetical protein